MTLEEGTLLFADEGLGQPPPLQQHRLQQHRLQQSLSASSLWYERPGGLTQTTQPATLRDDPLLCTCSYFHPRPSDTAYCCPHKQGSISCSEKEQHPVRAVRAGDGGSPRVRGSSSGQIWALHFFRGTSWMLLSVQCRWRTPEQRDKDVRGTTGMFQNKIERSPFYFWCCQHPLNQKDIFLSLKPASYSPSSAAECTVWKIYMTGLSLCKHKNKYPLSGPCPLTQTEGHPAAASSGVTLCTARGVLVLAAHHLHAACPSHPRRASPSQPLTVHFSCSHGSLTKE